MLWAATTKAGVAAAAKADAVEATAEKAAEPPVVPSTAESGVAEAAKTDAADATVANAAEPTPAEPCKATFDEQRWAGHTLDRLQAWGFNTIGNWSAPALGNADRVPYTLPLSIVGDYASISTGTRLVGRHARPVRPAFRHGHRARRGHCRPRPPR